MRVAVTGNPSAHQPHDGGGGSPPVSPEETLRSVFGYGAFRPHQREIIEGLIQGRDAFVLMPTGGGKSLCFQIPAMHRQGVGIVVSPLISLMKDQVDNLVACGVRAACYNSSLSGTQAREVLAGLHAGRLDLLYVAPERLMSGDFLSRLREVPVALFAIDEAHCISQWGHDFRREYRQLGRLRELFPAVPLIGLTATAEPHVLDDILERLGLDRSCCYVSGFDRPNIRYDVLLKRAPLTQLRGFIDGFVGESGVVYCLSRKRVEQVAAALQDAGYDVAAYHAGLSAARRQEVQEAFVRDELQIIVATVAFGMGIDKPDIRFVVHHDIPKNIESFYQETGRAGRDGLPAVSLLLFGYGDIQVARSLIEQSRSEQQKRIELHKLAAMVGFAEASGCRRRVLLAYFGEPLAEDCGNCDICLHPPQMVDATEDARKALSCIYRVGQRFGMGHVIDVLRGSRNQRLLGLGHDRLTTYGIGADKDKAYWGSLLRHLVHRGYVHQDLGKYAVLSLNASAWPLLKGEERLEMARHAGRDARVFSDHREAEYDAGLFDRLKSLRKALASEAGVPPYVVFNDRSLREMASRRPSSRRDMMAIHGVGFQKMERYGSMFLDVIAGKGHGPPPDGGNGTTGA